MKVHYIAGYGRSGSTLLGMLEGRRQNAVVLGEAYALACGTFLQSAVCSCGAPFPTCSYWATIDDALARHDHVMVSHSRRNWLEGIFGLLVPMFLLRRLAATAAFSTRYRMPYSQGVTTLATVSGGAFVDSSKTTRKTANRPRLLAAAGLDVQLYIATRRLPEVVESHHEGRRRHRLSSSRLRSWILVPLSRTAAHLAARRCAMSLRRPITWVALDQAAAQVAGTGDHRSRMDHLIAGNRMRHQHFDVSAAAQ